MLCLRNTYDEYERIMRREKLDFIQIDYALDNREAETRILPLARDRGMAVLINLPFGRGRLFRAHARANARLLGSARLITRAAGGGAGISNRDFLRSIAKAFRGAPHLINREQFFPVSMRRAAPASAATPAAQPQL